jgi:Fe-S cluster assembly protein SufD
MSPRTVVTRTRQAETPATAEFALGQADIQSLSSRLSEPAWQLERRRQAWEAYRSLPMPTVKDEAWRRTDIHALPAAAVARRPADEIPVDPELLRPLAGREHGALLTVVPGRPSSLRGRGAAGAKGIVFHEWQAALRERPDLLERYQGGLVPASDGKFAALAEAFAADGVVVVVPAGVQVEQPLHSVLWAPGTNAAFFSRVLVVLEKGASLTYVHETASPTEPEGAAVHAGIVEVLVGEEAQLTFVELQNWGEHVWNITHERAQVERNGRLNWIFGAVGSHLTKNFSELTLAGEGAEGRMSGFYFADGVQHLDHDTQQNHMAPHTTSDLLFKGALVGRSRSVWQGMIYVAPGAQKTDGYQANRNLILSKQARADSIPGLEILADDVRCTHGATVGQLEEEPVFYLMSRGLPRRMAERLVVDGFFAPIMERIPFEGVRARFQRMIDEKMS